MAGDETLFNQFKQKLIDTKRKWADEGRLVGGKALGRSADRLPPGQHLVRNWPVLDLGARPRLERWDWKLGVGGLVENPFEWTYQDFLGQRQTENVSDIHCVTSWSRFDNRWSGVSARDLIALARPKPEARFVLFGAYDGYTTNVKLEHFDQPDVLLASHWEGKEITHEHGGPVRVVVPKFYFWKSAKWVKSITFAATDKPGFWETRGYHAEGDPWNEDRYS